MRWVKRILIGLVSLVVLLLAVVVGALLWLHIPQNAAGVVAQTVCSAAFATCAIAASCGSDPMLVTSCATIKWCLASTATCTL